MTNLEQAAASTGDGNLRAVDSALAAKKVLRNTYLLLAMTLAFSASCAGASLALDLPHPSLLVTLAGYFGLLFLTTKFRESAAGLGFVFALTGFMGYTLDPILNGYLALRSGPGMVMTAVGGTAAVFIGLSAFALRTQRGSSFMAALLLAGILVAFLTGLGAVFLKLTGLALAVSAIFLLMSGLILYETRNILRRGETNYIRATVALYVAILNLFTSFLHGQQQITFESI